jgi:hypothetical protein
VKKQNWILEKLNLDKVVNALLEYLDIRLELFEIQLKERIVLMLSSVAVFMLIVSFGLFVILFFSLGAAVLINTAMKSSFLGFLIVGAVFFAFCVIIIAFKSKLITSRFIKVFFEKSMKESDHYESDE